MLNASRLHTMLRGRGTYCNGGDSVGILGGRRCEGESSGQMKVPHPLRGFGVGLAAIPPLLAVVLAVPTFRFRFLFDDFDFLIRAQNFRLGHLLPDLRSDFYRPISRELYFGLLTLLGTNSPMWGHVLNALLAATAVWLVTVLARRLAGPRAGLLSGMLFASFGSLPLLVGWICCSQDLLSIVALLAAIHCQLRRRTALAIVWTAVALLSKETVLFVVPVLVALRWVLLGDRSDLKRSALMYFALTLAWGAIHPKIQSLIVNGASTGVGAYVGLDNPLFPRNLIGLLFSLLNLPVVSPITPWPVALNEVLFVALGILAMTFWLASRTEGRKERPEFPERRVLLLSAGLLLLPGLGTAVFLKHWHPYYACIPAIGASLLAGVFLARYDLRIGMGAVAMFLVLGIWFRGADFNSRYIPTEKGWGIISADLEKVEAGMKKLRPSLPDSARLYMSVQTPRDRRIHIHLFHAQAPRVWYDNSSILTIEPERFSRGRGQEFLFWVAPNCDVFEIVLPSLRIRTGGARPDPLDYQKTLRNFGLGLFGAGYVDRAVTVFLGIQETDEVARDFDRRIASMLLFAAQRPAPAAQILNSMPTMEREQALYALVAVLGEVVPGIDLDSAAFRAFGIGVDDTEAYRYLMNTFASRKEYPQALRMANHLHQLLPRDEEASGMIEAIREIPRAPRVTIPPEVWAP